jgi:N,N'-diacetyllegionaminate synthase
MEAVNIKGRDVGPGQSPYIIAEIGANHNGDMDLCMRLIDAAHAAGADAVKFQSWSKLSLISKPEYRRNTVYSTGGKSVSSLERAVEQYALTPEQHRSIARHCQEKGITFFSSVFSFSEVDLLESLDAPVYKIASMDVNHLRLLKYVGSTRKPVILSTGLASLGEIELAIETLRGGGTRYIILLHCVSLYPSDPEIIHLRNIETLQRAFDVPVGYSDHALGTSIALASIACGACAIEKHFTLDRKLEGWDHALSSDPPELRYLVDEGRRVFTALGGGVRVLTSAQLEKRKAFRRRMVVVRDKKRGERLSLEDIDFKRPGTGIDPDELKYVLGRSLNRDLTAEDEVEWSDLN